MPPPPPTPLLPRYATLHLDIKDDTGSALSPDTKRFIALRGAILTHLVTIINIPMMVRKKKSFISDVYSQCQMQTVSFQIISCITRDRARKGLDPPPFFNSNFCLI